MNERFLICFGVVLTRPLRTIFHTQQKFLRTILQQKFATRHAIKCIRLSHSQFSLKVEESRQVSWSDTLLLASIGLFIRSNVGAISVFICTCHDNLYKHLLDQLNAQCSSNKIRVLLLLFRRIESHIVFLDDNLSLLIFVAIAWSMVTAFWSVYGAVFDQNISRKNFVGLLFLGSLCLFLQIMVMIHGCVTNETAEKVRHCVECLPYRYPMHQQDVEFLMKNFKDVTDNLWKSTCCHRNNAYLNP
ncbi:hypothetical protein HNY73_001254 [Argiope bruennichi]|uniref:Uncharacterized protein n=1 Tax=Argiope bruennichi TaxID=94029 RepID=A0A8T0G203_ARGBR|nr:hypothetical protein HNY73_001254 [Argiope bruennichi]